MRVNRYHILILFLLVIGSCIEPYTPVLEESQEVMVISGMISDSAGRHTVTVSLSSPYRFPEFNGVENCDVTLINQNGEIISYFDEGNGSYAADIPASYLNVGDAASIRVLTSDGKEYVSLPDTILACPELDSVYWELDYIGTNDPAVDLPGIQFYLDMNGKASDSRNIIWQVNETWEYWASLFGTSILYSWSEGEEFYTGPIFKCWKSYPLNNIYTVSTRNLSQNKIQRMPLNFVSNETDRLSVSYRLLVKQQSVTSNAFDYWQRMNEQALSAGTLYETQPASVPGNIYCTNNPKEEVLGYFYASQVKTKSVFVHNNNLFDFYVPHIECEYQPLSTLWQREHIDFPVYIYSPGPFQPSFWEEEECFDCRVQGGDITKPENWESWH